MGDDYEIAHVPAPAQDVLADFDERSVHFEVLDRRDQQETRPQSIQPAGLSLEPAALTGGPARASRASRECPVQGIPIVRCWGHANGGIV